MSASLSRRGGGLRGRDASILCNLLAIDLMLQILRLEFLELAPCM